MSVARLSSGAAHANLDAVENAGVARLARATSAWRGSSSRDDDAAAFRQRAGQPDGAVAAEGADFEHAPRAGDAHQQLEKFALEGRDVDGRKAGLAVGLEGGFERGVGGSEQIAEVAIDCQSIVFGMSGIVWGAFICPAPPQSPAPRAGRA